jgi:hypothetical protein
MMMMMMRTAIISLLLLCFVSVTQGADDDCVSTRGALGQWMKDDAREHDQQYAMPLHHIWGRTDERYHELVETQGPTFHNGEEHRSATQYHWLDQSSTCQIDYVERQELCQLTEQMGVKRIFFLGDSLTQEQAISLWMLMRVPEPTTILDDSRFERSIQCSPTHTLHIVFIHNEALLETPDPVSMTSDAKKGNCCPDRSCYCYPWFHEYSNFDGRTIVVANPGHSLTTPHAYREALGHFVQHINDSHRSDLVFLRTSVPGHVQCDMHTIHPYHDIYGLTLITNQYEKGKPELPAYNLTLSCAFNHITLTMAKEFDLQVLDIFAMTVLRRDGHLSEDPSYRGEGIPDNDWYVYKCVQYALFRFVSLSTASEASVPILHFVWHTPLLLQSLTHYLVSPTACTIRCQDQSIGGIICFIPI